MNGVMAGTIYLAAFLAALGAIGKSIRWAWRKARAARAAAFEAYHDSVREIVVAELEPIAAQLADIRAEVSLNGGRSVKDVVNKIAQALGVE